MKRLLVLSAIGAVAIGVVGLALAGTDSQQAGAPKAAPASSTATKAKPQKAKKAAPAKKTGPSRTKSKAKRSQGSDVVSSGPSGQSAQDAASYWTRERMKEAQPMSKSAPGGNGSATDGRPAGSVPAGNAPAPAKSKKKASAKNQKKSFGDGLVTSAPATGNAAEYWTPQAMQSAQPREKAPPAATARASRAPGSAPPRHRRNAVLDRLCHRSVRGHHVTVRAVGDHGGERIADRDDPRLSGISSPAIPSG